MTGQAAPADSASGAGLDFRVEVVRSRRRVKTIEARRIGGVLRVAIPSWMSAEEEADAVESMLRRFRRHTSTEGIDLGARARRLAQRYGLPRPHSIRWVTNQEHRWGSCTIGDRTIRMSDRLATFPRWVLDYVIVHELAHLVEANHSPAFHDLVARYPLAERARGFLIAKGLEPDDDLDLL